MDAEKQVAKSNRKDVDTNSPDARRTVGDFFASLRQYFFRKPFRIDSLPWSRHFINSLEQQDRDKWSTRRQTISEENEKRQDSGDKHTYKLIAELATGIWRVKRRFHQESAENDNDELRSLYRHVEATCDVLGKHEIEVKDDVGKKYVAGMAASVLAFQPAEDIDHDMIIETVRPSVFYKDTLVQRGEVIVATPKTTDEDHADVADSDGEPELDESIPSPDARNDEHSAVEQNSDPKETPIQTTTNKDQRHDQIND